MGFYLIGAVVVLALSWKMIANVGNGTVRILLGSLSAALLLSPTVIPGEGGAYIGPALFMCIFGNGVDTFRYVVVPISLGWAIFFAIGFVIYLLKQLLSRNH
jgi:hypothetical protein